MTTQYTTILKLALPVQGELSGTWGDTVNDNITQMVEQAIAGKATIDSWTANAHTLTTADGTTSESRCAILELTDTGTALTGAGTVTCPTNTKLYIVDNNTAQIITVKTSGGTGVAVPVGKTMLVYCDGTNVVEGVTHANSLSLGTSTVTADKILDEDNMASDSATALSTQQSIKAYVDSQVGTVDTLAEILANGNTTGANDIDVDTAQKVQFRDAAIYINSSADGQLDIVADGEVQIDTALVDINGNLDVSGTTNISGSVSFTKNAIAGVAISTTSRSSNTVTVTNSAVHGLTNGDLVNINGVANRSFNGYFTVSVSSTTVFTYSQTGADESSTGGTSTEIVYNLNASGTALNQMNGPLNIAANSGIDGLEITQSGSGEALSITGGNALFGDNDKAIFGIGNDLQIYHNGSNSFIDDAGTGNLQLRANAQIKLQKYTGENMFVGIADGAASMYYDNAQKIATTATGIQVTGTATMDGLTVNGTGDLGTIGNGAFNAAAALGFQSDRAFFGYSSSQNALIQSGASKGVAIEVSSDTLDSGTRAALFASNGDISFYEDTGTTPKFFWDASAESLGIGTDSPGRLLELKESSTGAGDAIIRLRGNGNNADNTPLGSLEWFNADSSGAQPSVVAAVEAQSANSNGHMGKLLFKTHDGSGSEADPPTTRMTIDQSGNVGIGTSSPSTELHVLKSGSDADVTIEGTGTGIDARLNLYANSTGVSQIRFGDEADTNVGLLTYDHSDDSMQFRVNDSERMRIDASGNVGIGTASPATLVDLKDTTPTLRLTDDRNASWSGNETLGNIEFFTSDASSNGTHVTGFIKNIQDQIGGSVQVAGALTFGVADYNAAATEAVRIDSSGNLLVGVTSTTLLGGSLTLPNSGIIAFHDAAGNARNTLQFVSGELKHGAAGGGLTSQTFFTSATERMRIDSSGNTHIGGTTSISTVVSGDNVAPKLIVEGTTATSIAILRQDTSIVSGNSLGSLGFYGTDTTSNTPTPLAAVQAVASGTHAAGDNPTELRFKVTADGSESLAEAMRIASSGNVGIGETSITSGYRLQTREDVDGDSKGLLVANRDVTASGSQSVSVNFGLSRDSGAFKPQAGRIRVGRDSTTWDGSDANIDSYMDFSVYESNVLSTKMTIDSSGKVGIGTASPISLLTVNNDGESFITIRSSDAGNAGIQFGDQSDSVQGAIYQNATDNSLRFNGYNNAEAMRIDSSRNLLVGKTSTGAATAGIELNGANDLLRIARDGGVLQELNRIGSGGTEYGSLIDFRVNNAAVGSINADAGYLAIGKGDTGLLFQDGGDAIQPRDITGLANRDAAIDLGVSGGRFKDLYLSGGVVFGATGGAVTSKTLEDYEEGTWTPVYAPSTGSFASITMDSAETVYTKVGRMVTVSGIIRTDDIDVTGGSGAVLISGLPFPVSHWSAISLGRVQGFGGDMPDSGYGGGSAYNINLYYRATSNGATAVLNVTDLADGAGDNSNYIFLEYTYQSN